MNPPVRCRHYSCQCDAADKLAAQGLPERAVELHRDNALVRCVLDRKLAEARAVPADSAGPEAVQE